MNDRPTKTCDECGSLYFGDSSRMSQLCPECSYLLYGYEPCTHTFVDGRCSQCHWDGSMTPYCQNLKEMRERRPHVLTLHRAYPVPVEVLFHAWTDPVEFLHWADLRRCTIDLRAGGSYLISHPTTDEEEDLTTGRYLEVIIPQRLVFTWEGASPGGPTGETAVTLEFTPTESGSTCHLRHEFLHEYSMRECEWGWNDWLDSLARHLAGKGGVTP
jgi:uncharacterized protein YndB with AHSA1/START domain